MTFVKSVVVLCVVFAGLSLSSTTRAQGVVIPIICDVRPCPRPIPRPGLPNALPVKSIELERSSRLDAESSHLLERRCVGLGRRVVLHEPGEQIEVGGGAQGVDLVPDRGLHVDLRVDSPRWRRVRLAIGAQGYD